jgi:hypothetical protein
MDMSTRSVNLVALVVLSLVAIAKATKCEMVANTHISKSLFMRFLSHLD